MTHVGTVTQTPKLEDRIPALILAAGDRIEEMTFEEGADHPARVALVNALQSLLGSIEGKMAAPGYFASDGAYWDAEALLNTLDSIAPEGLFFGMHPDDPEQLGWWTTNLLRQ